MLLIIIHMDWLPRTATPRASGSPASDTISSGESPSAMCTVPCLGNATRLAELQAPGSAKAAIRRYFDGLLVFAAGEGRRLGCLITNSAVELAPHDRQIGTCLRESLGRVEQAFHNVIERGQAQGEISPEKDPRALARFLVNTVQGLRVLSRADSEPAVFRDVVAVTLAALD